MSGYLRLNGVTGKYDFVFTDPVDFDTEANQTPTDISPAQLTIKVGEKAYTRAESRRWRLGLSSSGPEPEYAQAAPQRVYATNAADGAEQPGEVQRLASDLTYAADARRGRW